MKLAHLSYLASTAGFVAASSAGCSPDSLVVVENDAGTKGNTSDAGSGNTGDGGDAGNGAGVCVPNGITFKLDVGTTDDVYFGGSTPPWPVASFGCPGWLTISTAVASPWGLPAAASINVVKACLAPQCPASQPEPAAAQSFTWDGTYYPVATSSGACDIAACAPPGVYGVTMCVGYAGPDAGHVQGAPTCQRFSFDWPPANPGEALVEATITPTLGGM